MGNSSSTGTNQFDVQIAESNNKRAKEKDELESKTKIELARIQAQSHKEEVEAKKAAIELGRRRVECDHAKAMGTVEVEKLFIETQHNVVNGLMEKGYDAEEFCMTTIIARLAMQADIPEEDAEYMKQLMDNGLSNRQTSGQPQNGKKKKVASTFLQSTDDQEWETNSMSLKQG